MEEPLVSVIIPVYNREKLVADSIKSVLNQTYSNLEVIVVDDCSTDGTEGATKSVGDKRIKYVRLEKNSGACAARNRGIEEAAGKFISFNDSDDRWIGGKIEAQIDFLQKNDADVVLCKMRCFSADGKFLHDFPDLFADRKLSYDDLLLYNASSTQTFFGKAECFKKNPFDSRMPRLQDWDEILRISQNHSVFFQDKILVDSFLQPDSISTHPEKGVRAMEMLFEKHGKKIMSDAKIAESFFRKKSSFVCRSGKNPEAEMKVIFKIHPSPENFLKFILAELRLYKIFFGLKNSL